jgi:hypothetical protein
MIPKNLPSGAYCLTEGLFKHDFGDGRNNKSYRCDSKKYITFGALEHSCLQIITDGCDKKVTEHKYIEILDEID